MISKEEVEDAEIVLGNLERAQKKAAIRAEHLRNQVSSMRFNVGRMKREFKAQGQRYTTEDLGDWLK